MLNPLEFRINCRLKLCLSAIAAIFPFWISIPEAKADETEQDSEYLVEPRIISDDAADPFATTLPLNGSVVSHLTQWEFIAGIRLGDDFDNTDGSSDRTDEYQLNAILAITGQIEQSITRDNIFTIDHQGTYFQFQSVRTERQVTTTRRIPSTLLGFRLGLTLTADCLFSDTNTNEQCSYTPAIEIDPNSFDPDTLRFTDVLLTGEAREIVTPDSLEAIRQPGFQRGANGQEIGIDLAFPNVGSRAGNSQRESAVAGRVDDIDRTPALAISRVRQIVRGNDRETVVTRTVRGNIGIIDSENTLFSFGIQAAAELLPDLVPSVQGSENPVNTQLNRNLFLAANSARLPEDSLTIYHAGMARAASLEERPATERELPAVGYHSLWVGLSPITKRRIEQTVSLETTGSPRVTSASGNEGGNEGDISFVSVIDGETFATAELDEFYAQTYLTNFETDADIVATETLTEDTDYYPHLSFTGNLTDASGSFRYYTGIIASPKVIAYSGLDYSQTNTDGLRYGVGAIGYLNPDRDYYSHIRGNIAKAFRFGRRENLTLFGDFRWEFDRPEEIGIFEVGSRASFLRVGANAQLDSLSLSVTSFICDVIPSSIQDTLQLNLALQLTPSVRVSGLVTLVDESSSRINYGLSSSIRLGRGRNAPSLVLRWRNLEYDLGRDRFGNTLTSSGNVFSVFFRVGNPREPFRRSRR